MGGARGEQTIRAGEEDVQLLFTNRALADAEKQMGKSVFGAARGLSNGQTGVGDVAYLLQAGMQAARRDAGERPVAVSLERAFAVMDKAGVTVVTLAVIEALAEVLNYKSDQNGADPDKQDGADPNG